MREWRLRLTCSDAWSERSAERRAPERRSGSGYPPFRPRHIGSCSPYLEGTGKAGLCQRIASTLDPAGRFVLADVVEPVGPSYVVTEIDLEVDHPSKLDEQLAWLEAARLFPEVTWTHRDLVVIVASPG